MVFHEFTRLLGRPKDDGSGVGCWDHERRDGHEEGAIMVVGVPIL